MSDEFGAVTGTSGRRRGHTDQERAVAVGVVAVAGIVVVGVGIPAS